MKPSPPGIVTALTGVVLMLLGLAIMLGGAATYNPPRPSSSVGWGFVGALVIAFGLRLLLSVRRR
jgi:hypothetical protein